MIPINGFMVALEVWGNGSGGVRTWLVTRTMVGTYELWSGIHTPPDGRIVACGKAAGSEIGPISDSGLTRTQQTWTREDAVRTFLARTMRATIGGQDGWHPCYQGPVVLDGLTDRFGASSRFRAVAPAAPVGAAAPAPVPSAFDPSDFKARLAARRNAQAAAAQAQADLRVEAEDGRRRVKAFRAQDDRVMLADLPVAGLTETGDPISGRIHSCNPQYAVVEVALDELARVTGPITWVYDPHHPLTVGLTAADHH